MGRVRGVQEAVKNLAVVLRSIGELREEVSKMETADLVQLTKECAAI